MKTNSKKWLKRLGIFLGTLILIVVGYVVYVFPVTIVWKTSKN